MNRARRQSNLELMRIILMFAIIAHHYVVNSGVTDLFGPPITSNSLFLEIWGMWGKAAINAFVLVTGYFMCTSRLTWTKVIMLISEVMFYIIVVFIIMAIIGYQPITLTNVALIPFGILCRVGRGFTSSFLTFYLFIPFLNNLVSQLDSKGLDRLLVLTLGINVGTVTFFKSAAFNEVIWYAVLYLVAARIRLYPSPITESFKLSRTFFIASVLLSIFSVAVLGLLSSYLGREGVGFAYYFVSDSSKIMAFFSGLSCFLFFKNLSFPHSLCVNRIASTTFGVFLIHANSDAMRDFLWRGLLKVPIAYYDPLPLLVLHASLSMIGVFVVCSAIDLIRQVLIEKSFTSWVISNREHIETGARSIGRAVESRLEPILCLVRPSRG